MTIKTIKPTAFLALLIFFLPAHVQCATSSDEDELDRKIDRLNVCLIAVQNASNLSVDAQAAIDKQVDEALLKILEDPKEQRYEIPAAVVGGLLGYALKLGYRAIHIRSN